MEGIQRLGAILQAGASASRENLPALWKSLLDVHAELLQAAPEACDVSVTDEPTASIELSDGEEDAFLDEFLGADGDGSYGGGGGGDGCGARSEQRQTEAKQKLRKASGKVEGKSK